MQQRRSFPPAPTTHLVAQLSLDKQRAGGNDSRVESLNRAGCSCYRGQQQIRICANDSSHAHLRPSFQTVVFDEREKVTVSRKRHGNDMYRDPTRQAIHRAMFASSGPSECAPDQPIFAPLAEC